jgi:YHS domain-containing protein
MKNIRLILVLGAALGMLAFGLGLTGIAQAAPQTLCPVLGNKIDKNVFVDYHGERIYFCCSGCINEFKKNPAKYLEKMKSEGVTPAKMQ